MLKTAGKVNSSESLLIFDYFEEDEGLPKFRLAQSTAKRMGANLTMGVGSSGLVGSTSGIVSLEDEELLDYDSESGGHTWRFNSKRQKSFTSLPGWKRKWASLTCVNTSSSR